MRHMVAASARLGIVISVIGLGLGQYRAQASSSRAQATQSVMHATEPVELLVYQGRILPIVTDVYTSINDLGTAINDRNVENIAKIGDQFAGEQLRFIAVRPVPRQLKGAAGTMEKGLRNLSTGTTSLVQALRASDTAASQRAANQLVVGLKQFQLAVSQVRSLAGPKGQTPQAGHAVGGTPVPTPIIRGLP